MSTSQVTSYATIEDFLHAWTPKIKTAIYHFGFRDSEVDDIFQELMLEWVERDYFSNYDPNKGTWATYVYGFVNIRLKGHYHKKMQHLDKNKQLDTLDFLGRGTEIADPQYELLKAVEKTLETLPIRGSRDLKRLFVDLAVQVIVIGFKSQNDLAEKYGVSPTAISYMLADLRTALIAKGLVIITETGKVEWL